MAMKLADSRNLSLWGAIFSLLLVGAYPAQAQDLGAELLPEAYLGKWYELARTPNENEDNTPVRDGQQLGPCRNSTATYELVDASRIRIDNQCERAASDGTTVVDNVEGEGIIVPDSGNRKLKIAFGDAWSRFFMRLFTGGGADYWVYGLGPIAEDGRYEWAVVSGPERDYIFILTRTPQVSDETKAEILELAEAEGLPVDALIYPATPAP
jgi:apolipoprotein D and lipocalin family protein